MPHSFLTKNIIPGDITVTSAKGVKFWDKNNKEYLDFSSYGSNINSNLQSDNLRTAFSEQFSNYTHLSQRFANESLIDLSKKLVEIAPDELTKVNIKLTNGTGANESAFKRTRIFRKKPYILSFYWSELGESCETLKANGKYNNTAFFGGSSYFLQLTPPFLGLKTEEQVLSKIELLFRFREDIGGIILEPIMLNAGGYAFSKFFLTSLRTLCDTYGITLIFDEIQTGCGWLGKFFAAEYFGVTPDIVTIGNGFASGFPFAGVLMKEEYDVLDTGYDEHSSGGHPVSCTVALENIKFIEESHLLEHVPTKSKYMQDLFKQLEKEFKKVIREVRISGLIAGIEFTTNQLALTVYEKALEKGLVLKKARHNFNGGSLLLKPSLIVSEDEIQEAINILRKSIQEVI